MTDQDQSAERRAVAIVAVGAILPDAPDVDTFWQNLTNGRYSISDVPAGRWDPEWYYDPDPAATDKTYSKIGGWVQDFEWDPMAWRLPIPPKVADVMDDAQKWAVACTRAVLADYGAPERDIDRERTAVIIGNAMAGENHYRTALRVDFPVFAEQLRGSSSFQELAPELQQRLLAEARDGLRDYIPDITEDTMPGELANIIAGRVANIFDLHGPNFVTDAACASALAAFDAAIEGLDENEFDCVITGGVDRNMGPATFVKFCKIGALSSTGTRPYAEGADGFVMGEGAALFMLKRLEDAERDGDRVYAVIRGVGGSSDGRGKGITAPNPAGQRLAVERAWKRAGLSPASASYVEGHGTSTKVGDVVEFEGLTAVFGGAGAPEGSIGLGSVKSNIGHLKGGAGAAGLLKTVLSLHHGQLPPSIGFAAPNPNIDFTGSPLRIVDELREWTTNGIGPRRAGVSAFGFGGTNFHAVLEEHRPGELTSRARSTSFARGVPDSSDVATGPVDPGVGLPASAGPSSPAAVGVKAPLRGAVVVGGDDDSSVAAQLKALGEGRGDRATASPAPPDPSDLAAPVRVAIDFDDAEDLAAKARKCASALESGNEAAWRMLANQGAFLGRGAPAKVAFLYTGQGSQYVNMLSELASAEPIVGDVFADADRVMEPLLGRPLTDYIFTDPADEAAVTELSENLKRTEITQPAVLATDLALTRLLAAYGMTPDMVMGHSLGEYGALVAAGSLTFDSALEAVSARGREMAELEIEDNGAMAAVMAPLAEIESILDAVEGYVVLANVNSNNQSVIGGATVAVEAAVAELTEHGHTAMRIPVSHAFHTSIVAPASAPLRDALHRLGVQEPTLPVVANVTGEFYPSGGDDDERVLDLLGRQVASPVQFVKGLHTLHDAGARVFVEVGPKRALHGFVQDVLDDDVLALYTNHPKQGDLVAFNRALCGLWASGHGSRPTIRAERAPGGTATMNKADSDMLRTDPETGKVDSEKASKVDEDTYLELGHLFAEFLDRGRAVYDRTAGSRARSDGPGGASQAPVVITGASLGVPGTEQMFGEGDLRRILDGDQFIDQIPNHVRNEILEKHIVRLVKRESGDPTFEEIGSAEEVIKLAGRAGSLDLADFGIDADRIAALDIATKLAIGAGVGALRDAGLPLVMHYKTTTVGSQLPERWMLPEELRDETGVVFASAFPGGDALVGELDRFHEDKSRQEKIDMLEKLCSRVEGDSPAAVEIEHELHELRLDHESDPFRFDRRFLFRVLAMGHSQFAELIGARGPNTQINAACASTTQAVTLAEDWIRAGRCRRVVVVAGDDASSDNLIDWIGSGFLASGAAATDSVVEEAALPFDNRRHGMILGMGAAAMVVESPDAAAERGIRPICEVLGAVTANSAFHGTRLDVQHIGQVMEATVAEAESHGIDRGEIAEQTVFVSHETYTPARGGSASAEINALRSVFGTAADDIVIANTKGLTGHPMGAGIEDVVAVKALETGIVPPVPNFKEVDPELGTLNISTGGIYPVRYALRLAAGFGSQIAMLLLRWTPMPDGRHREPDELGYRYRIDDQAAWNSWLERVAGSGAEVEVDHHWLRVRDDRAATRVATPGAPGIEDAPPLAYPEPVATAPSETEPPAPVAPVPPGEGSAVVEQPVAGSSAGDDLVDRVLVMVSEATGYPADMLDPELDMEADLGIDTVKQAEVFGAIRESFGIERDDRLKLRDYPTLGHVVGFVRDRAEGLDDVAGPGVVADPGVGVAPDAAGSDGGVSSDGPVGSVAADAVVDRVLVMVSEATGYPADMLDPELDMEADLGIDTVKQAEVFGAIRESFGIERDDRLKLRDYPTLGHVVGFVRDRAEGLDDVAGPGVVAEPGAGAATVGSVAADAVVDRVLVMVSEATGYPADMLDPELDMEADLGIDTVKQAEVFGAIRESFGIERDDRLKLRDYPTLGHVVGFVRDRAGTDAVVSASGADSGSAEGEADIGEAVHGTVGAIAHITTAPPEGSLEAADEVPRRVPVPELRPDLDCFVTTGVDLGEGARVVIRDDEGGVAPELVGLLEARGVEVLRLSNSTTGEGAAQQVTDWLAEGELDGLYWLSASDAEADETRTDIEAFRAAARTRVLDLHRVMRALLVGHDTADGAAEPPFLVSVTRLGGLHGYGDKGATAPMGGAVTGYTKAYAREQADALVKVVDHSLEESPSAVAQSLVAETLRDPGPVEVGYNAGHRWTIGLRSESAADGGEPMHLGEESVFVVTGAAGSIVSAIIADLARHSGGTFHLLDLTPEPDREDPDIVALETDRDALQRDIFERLKAAGERATPAAVERELARIERLEAALAAIEAVEDAGGTAHYHCVDLRDADAVSQAMEAITAAHDRIDVLVHAAGIEVSRPIADKTQEEFELVFGVKSEGWVNLMAAAGDISIGATFVFSSVAGRFGNLGQSDYSSANDLLCKYTSALRTTRADTRATAVDWTAWADIGMATRGSIPKMMEMAGIEMLPATAGIATLRRELTEGATRGEVLVAGALGVLGEERSPAGGLDPGSLDTSRAGPLLQRAEAMGVYEGLVLSAELDPTALAFLDDHRIEDVAVLPGVMGLEAFAEAAKLLCPERHVAAVEDVEFSAPFKFYRDEPRTIRVVAHGRADGPDIVVDCRLIGERTLAGASEPQRTVHFGGSVRMTDEAPSRPTGQKTPDADKKLDAAQVYGVYFHGPAFQVLGEAWCSAGLAVGSLAGNLPDLGLDEDQLLMAPRLIELCFQTAGVQEMGTEGRMGLPVRIASVTAFDPRGPAGDLHALVEPSGEGTFDCRVVDGRGAVVVAMDGYGTIALPAAVESASLDAFSETMSASNGGNS